MKLKEQMVHASIHTARQHFLELIILRPYYHLTETLKFKLNIDKISLLGKKDLRDST